VSWLVVAKKDFRDALRSRAVIALSVVFVLLMAGAAFLFQFLQGQNDQALSTLGLVSLLGSPVALLVPLIGLLLGYGSLAGEVESGSVKFLLSLPHSRLDAVLGKLAGRATALAVGLSVGIAAAAVVILATYEQPQLGSLLVFTLLTYLFGLTYVAIGVGLSGVASSRSRAITLVVGFYVVFEILWGVANSGLYYLLEGSFSPPVRQTAEGIAFDAPGWYFFVPRLAPRGAYSGTLTGFVQDGTFAFSNTFPDGIPAYLSEWAALALLLVWLVALPTVGYLRFREADL
jgi:ABC-2 type transport system permease protein